MATATIVTQSDSINGPPESRGVVTIDLGSGISEPTTFTVADGGVRADSGVTANLAPGPSRETDELEFANIDIRIGTIVPGVSFELIVEDLDGGCADGTFNVHYTRS
jgi:hypothetical protein